MSQKISNIMQNTELCYNISSPQNVDMGYPVPPRQSQYFAETAYVEALEDLDVSAIEG